jgi:hypothetical protein
MNRVDESGASGYSDGGVNCRKEGSPFLAVMFVVAKFRERRDSSQAMT